MAEKLSNQEVLIGVEKRLAVGENALREVLVMLLQADRPFVGAGHNVALDREVEEFAGIYFGLKRWHRSVACCAAQGDPELRFGGK
jgi:hypothetical protein